MCDIEDYVTALAKPAIEHWFARQQEEKSLCMTAYYKPATTRAGGLVVISDARPGPEWKVIRAERIPADATKEQVADLLNKSLWSLPILPPTNDFEPKSYRKYPGAADVTDYAESIGYTGTKPVMVSNGRVVSHQHQEAAVFFEKCRKQAEEAKNVA